MPVTPCINEALPAEVFGVIFEEHAKLEWRAPVIDGLVCRQWRQTILHTPRAWAHLEIGDNFRSLPSELRQQWLGRSGMAPLHIRVSYLGGVAEILDQHYKRFESLAVYHSIVHSLLENRSFPILQSLTVYGPDIYSGVFRFSNWGAMPALRSLRVCGIPVDILPSKAVPAWRVLALCRVKEYEHIVKNSYHSLTTLMLDGRDAPNTPETLEFPSLSFLSLFAVGNLKHRMRVPALTTYHEASAKTESFSMILPLLTEYGISQINMQPLFNIIVTRLHYCYPNLSRFSPYEISTASILSMGREVGRRLSE